MNKRLIILFGFLTTVYVQNSDAAGSCSCTCANCLGCELTFQGTIIIPSCFDCEEACKDNFPDACTAIGFSHISLSCTEVPDPVTSTTTTTRTISTSSSTATLTTVSTPQPSATTARPITAASTTTASRLPGAAVPTRQSPLIIASLAFFTCMMF